VRADKHEKITENNAALTNVAMKTLTHKTGFLTY